MQKKRLSVQKAFAAASASILVAILFTGGCTKTEPVAALQPTILMLHIADTPTPAPTAIPTPTPTTTPALPNISFNESAELHLPNLTEVLPSGQMFHLRGTVSAEAPLTSVSVVLTRPSGTVDTYTVEFDPSENTTEYALNSTATLQQTAMSELVPFAALDTGRYDMEILAKTILHEQPVTVAKTAFDVADTDPLRLYSNNFRENYIEALTFFGNTDFLFSYRWADGRHITTDPNWQQTYLTTVQGLDGRWRVHTAAAPYFSDAVRYIESTYLRVHSDTADSGVICLESLAATCNGTYVSRFVSDRTFVSHHALGTAVDINASLAPNRNAKENRTLIRDEVSAHLVYNGVLQSGKRSYYDFTYTGECADTVKNVPVTVVNYLLYELGFFRAGFGWGYYYGHTCDAMHFTLTEFDISVHSDPENGLRKVVDYIGQ